MPEDSVNDAINSLLKIHESVDARLDSIEKEQSGIHVEWQRDRATHIRLEARTEALLSMLTELLAHSGASEERVAACFRQRFLHFQDRAFQEAEAVSPDFAAHIDTRVSAEIPTDQGFDPLFPVG